ncbi:MAG: DUF2085 domain-containing protein [Candidatus Micrarchaeota archaeon]|nr:DUF2085 domain-containing protein [Candidatus Micrarchaeota archaeon]
MKKIFESFEKLRKIKWIGFWIFFIAIFFLNFFLFLTPILKIFEFHHLADGLYFGFSFTCHQLNSRSLCIFNNSIEDCTSNSSNLEYTKTQIVLKENKIGYKFPVCARDLALYFSLLVGTICWGFINRKNLSAITQPPFIFLVFALLPLGIDGSAQFLGLWESSNLIRLLTGFLAGFVCAFYAIPIFNFIFKNSLEVSR